MTFFETAIKLVYEYFDKYINCLELEDDDDEVNHETMCTHSYIDS